MQTFLQFTLIEQQHKFVKAYKDWGIIHPKTGQVISGLKDTHAKHHDELKKRLAAKIQDQKHKTEMSRAPEYAHVDFGHGDGHLMVRSVNNENKHAVLKVFDHLPHHVSGEVRVNEKHKGPIPKMRGHIQTADFDDPENY